MVSNNGSETSFMNRDIQGNEKGREGKAVEAFKGQNKDFSLDAKMPWQSVERCENSGDTWSEWH